MRTIDAGDMVIMLLTKQECADRNYCGISQGTPGIVKMVRGGQVLVQFPKGMAQWVRYSEVRRLG